ncbi:hypothetical protein J4207_01650 [Candidatus Woesearchaeota archaeon]|nr:hypothetical protein [Candidatus Woesearchaeota archaeon]
MHNTRETVAYRALDALLTPRATPNPSDSSRLPALCFKKEVVKTIPCFPPPTKPTELKEAYQKLGLEDKTDVFDHNVEALDALEHAVKEDFNAQHRYNEVYGKAETYIAQHYVKEEVIESPQKTAIEKVLSMLRFWERAEPRYVIDATWMHQPEMKPLLREMYTALDKYDKAMDAVKNALARFDRTDRRVDEFLRAQGKQSVKIDMPVTQTTIGKDKKWVTKRKVILSQYT